MWRESYGSGFTLRPDLSLMGVVSGLEMACWDIIGKAVEQPVYQLLGGRVHERLRSYTYLYPAEGEGEEFYHDADRSAARAAEYVKLGFTGLKFDPTGGYSVFDPRQPTQEQIERTVRLVRLVREAVGDKADLLVGTHGQFTTSGADSAGQAAGALRSALVRGAGARPRCRSKWRMVARGTSIPIATGERLTTKYEFARVLGRGRRQHPADESRAGRRLARGQEGRGARRSALRANRAASLLRPRGRRGQHSDRDLLAEFSDSGKHPAMGRIPCANSEEADSLGGRAT